MGWLLLLLIVVAAGLLALLRWQPAYVPDALQSYLPSELIEAVSLQEGAPTSTDTAALSVPAEPNGPAIYAWKDDQGRWNYTDEPPANRPYETRQYRQDVNVVPAYQGEPDEG